VTRRIRIGAALALAAAAVPASAAAAGAASGAPSSAAGTGPEGPAVPGAACRPHPLHFATAQVAVEGSRVLVRLRTFQDDLETALARFDGRESVAMAATPGLDSLYLSYVSSRLEVVADGSPLSPAIVASGVDEESGAGDTRVWWALLEYEAASGIRELGVRATLLYEIFRDQRNVIRVLHPATDARRTFYFAAPDDDLRTVRFG
jgi:hypothetical protein